ncbi:dihydropteroate synthase [Lutimonas sp.]|uniref:dihydropteroate synthase n=1 Tax=Lutimonas sp. TaxID=1872403 RepID=UPI003D9BBB2F
MLLNCKGQLLDVTRPKIMGILNVTPDSFYDGGRYKSEKEILNQVEKMLEEGATFIDLGAYSSRPNADHISEKEEMSRLLPMVKLLVKTFPGIHLSIDTFRSQIAKEAVYEGAGLINDISAGGLDKNMFATVSNLQVPYCIMHMIGTPQNMQNNTTYEDLLKDMIHYFSKKIFELRQLGLNDILIDPGFGFSKTLNQNFELLQKMDLLNTFNLPVLVGLSRKSMLYKPLNSTAVQALNATTAAHMIALKKGAKILRVHDVKEAREAILIFEKTGSCH